MLLLIALLTLEGLGALASRDFERIDELKLARIFELSPSNSAREHYLLGYSASKRPNATCSSTCMETYGLSLIL